MGEVPLGIREPQIVEAVCRLGEASVADVLQALPDPPTYSSVQAMLNLLVEKQVLTFRQDGKRCLYRTVASKGKTWRAALRNLVRNFFIGKPLDANDRKRLRQLLDELERTT